ncbi:MAG: bifunctional phosphoribosylaminoimidazolecarboxamide formyltransferase/IMP cyclohydrolase [Gemmatimonadetes bacterium]|nr:bifunctional phosphoribosylaminoimidazolecarboxamide formyltransferase/IMP cyclohydrolase [Gemmatimonadota bacterium]
MPRALLSVSDKAGIVELARGLVELGWEVLSTGGTARALRKGGIAVRDVGEVTGHPEMMEGRVKTLHPAIHAGLLARRDRQDDLAALRQHAYGTIDLVACNLYPFAEAAAAGVAIPVAMEQVDIGGPAMLRAAAKNHAGVLALVDPADYARVLDALRHGAVDAALRLHLAHKIFAHTTAYDAAIATYLAARLAAGAAESELPRSFTPSVAHPFPEELALRLSKVQDLRYGENPEQPAAFYAEAEAPGASLPALEQLHGKELSFNNLLDVDAAAAAAAAWAGAERPACVIVKHTTPCGIALGADAADAYRRALEADPVSAFGGVVAFTVGVSGGAAEAMANTFLEVVVAPDFDAHALEVLKKKKNLRLILLPVSVPAEDELDYKRVRGGLLVQRRLPLRFPEEEWRVVTKRQPSGEEWRDLRFAWRAAAMVKSNAIVLAREERTVGIGAGQMSRVDASRVAVMKARDQGFDLKGAALASDAFFPFRDGVDAAAEAGITAVIQPGGSMRDQEVIQAADGHGIAMVFTGRRLFRH